MKNKLLILSIIITFNIGFVSGQIKERNFLLSDTKFEVLKHSTAIFDSTNKNPSSLYLKVDLPQNVKDNFSKLSKATIMQLLADTTTDWATNLLLYEKYDRDAYLFFTVIHTRKDWLPVKKSDIAYWKKKLK
jgi:hypothetical protein